MRAILCNTDTFLLVPDTDKNLGKKKSEFFYGVQLKTFRISCKNRNQTQAKLVRDVTKYFQSLYELLGPK